MKKGRVSSLVFLFTVIIALVGTAFISDGRAESPAGSTAQFNWRAQDAAAPTTINNYAFLKLFCTLVNERSKGRIHIQHYHTGAILPPFGIFDGVAKGTVEFGSNSGAYYMNKIPEGQIEYGLAFEGLPLHLFHEMAYEYRGGQFMKILRQVYAERGIHYLAISPNSGYGFMTNFPIHKIEDLKGHKIRTTGTVMIEFLKQVGAVPVAIPGAETYMALQRKTVDGITLLFYLLESSKLAEVVKYVTLPEVYDTASLNLLMNLEAYNKLPNDLKTIVDDTAEEVTYKYLMYGLRGLTDCVLEWAKGKYGLQINTLPEAEVVKMRNMVRPLDKLMLKTPRCRQLYDIRTSFLREKKIWK